MNQYYTAYLVFIRCAPFFKGNCSEERTSQLTWPPTQPGQTVMQSCFPYTTSTNLTATRTCDSNGNWMAPNTSDCTNGKSITDLPACTCLCDLCLYAAIPLLRLTPSGSLYNVTVGDPFTLQCTAEGNQPVTSVEWVKVQGNQQSCN